MRLFSFLAAVFFITVASNAQTAVPSADEVLRPVFAKAAKENKNVLLIFHASWCGWCRKMDSSLADQSIKPLIDRNYEIAHLTLYESPNKKNLENPGALDFITKHGGTDQGLPYWFVLDKKGNVLADSQYQPTKNTGCPASEEEVAYFITVLRKTSTLKEPELDTIKKRFRKNEQ
jgi:thiol-disulfide isomerase/thioredoxin